MFRCALEKENMKQQNKKKKPIAHATGHTTGSRARNDRMNFCVNMVKCTVDMSVYVATI